MILEITIIKWGGGGGGGFVSQSRITEDKNSAEELKGQFLFQFFFNLWTGNENVFF